MADISDKNIDIKQQAREWLAAVNSDQISDEERGQFLAWLEADKQHSAAFEQVDTLWQQIAELDGLRALDISVSDNDRAARTGVLAALKLRWREAVLSVVARPAWTMVAAAVALIIIVSPELIPERDVSPVITNYKTDVARQRDVALADGSLITLGAKTSATVTLGQTERRVNLVRGEAFFSVAKDSERPFTVSAANTQVRVIGTEFNVRRGAEKIDITVLQGTVDVLGVTTNSGQTTATVSQRDIRRLVAGQQVSATFDGQLSEVRQARLEQSGAWRDGRLGYDNAPLREVIADANRYYEGRIILASQALDDLTVTTSFRIDQIDQMLNSLIIAHDIEIEKIGRDILIKPKQKKRQDL